MPDRKPRVFYGWVLVAVAFVSTGLGFAVVSVFSLLVGPLQREFGWSSTGIVAAYALQSIGFGVSSPLVGRMTDRLGARLVIPIGGVMLGVGMIGFSMCNSLWLLYLIYGGLCGAGLALVTPVANMTVLSHWFVRRRGLAMGLGLSGGGLSSLAVSPLFQGMISTHGWRFACQALGGLVILVVVPLNLLLQRQRPQDVGLLPDNGLAPIAGHRHSLVVDTVWAGRDWTLGRAIRTWRFWAIFGGMFMAWCASDSIRPLESPMLVTAGYDAMLVAAMIGVGNSMMAVGRACWGGVSDRIGREATSLIGGFCFLAGIALMYAIQALEWPFLIYLYSLALGLGIGMLGPVSSAIAADLFQGRNFGSVYGFLCLAMGTGGLVGPLFTGYLYDVTGSYRTGLTVDLVALCVMIGLFWSSSPHRVRLVPGRAEAQSTAAVEEAAGGAPTSRS